MSYLHFVCVTIWPTSWFQTVNNYSSKATSISGICTWSDDEIFCAGSQPKNIIKFSPGQSYMYSTLGKHALLIFIYLLPKHVLKYYFFKVAQHMAIVYIQLYVHAHVASEQIMKTNLFSFCMMDSEFSGKVIVIPKMITMDKYGVQRQKYQLRLHRFRQIFCIIVFGNTQRFNTRKQEGGVNSFASFFIGWNNSKMADGVLRNTSTQKFLPGL